MRGTVLPTIANHALSFLIRNVFIDVPKNKCFEICIGLGQIDQDANISPVMSEEATHSITILLGYPA